MKISKLKYLLILISTLIGCSDLTELNQNPTTSTSMSPELLITTIQLYHSQNHQSMHRYLVYPGGFMNHWNAENATVKYGGYGAKFSSYWERLWINSYPNNVKNVVDLVVRTSNDSSLININAMGRILKVEVFLKLTDFYGDLPYSEAGRGYTDGIIKPIYDKQEDIYKDFLKELKEAVLSFSETQSSTINDLYFNGDIGKWKRFANSMRLRIAMRLIKVDPVLAQQEAEAAVILGVMTSNADIAFVKHEVFANPSTGDGPGNGYSNIFLTSGTRWRMSDLFVQALGGGEVFYDKNSIPIVADQAEIDPRIYYAGGAYAEDENRTDITAAVLSTYNRLFGISAQNSLSKTAYRPSKRTYPVIVNGESKDIEATYEFIHMQPSKLITNFGAPFIHLSYAETQYYMAEMAIRGWNVGGVTLSDLYKNGLSGAIDQWSIFGADTKNDEAKITPFIAEQVALFDALSTPEEKMDEVAKQMWISSCMDPFETWSYFRRLDGGDMTLVKYAELTAFLNNSPTTNNTGGKTPRRLQYPLDEQLKNEENYKEAVARMGGTDDWMNRVWWDKDLAI